MNLASDDLVNISVMINTAVSLRNEDYVFVNETELVKHTTNFTPEEIAALAQYAKDDSTENFFVGVNHFLEGRNEEALISFEKSVKYGEQRDLAYFFMARIFYVRQEYLVALQYYDLSLKENISFIYALTGKGEALGHLGRYEESLTVFDEGVLANNGCYECWYDKGYSLVMLNRTDEAIFAFNQSIAIYPYMPAAWANIGNLLFNKGDYVAGIAAYERALAIDPVMLQALYNYGVALRIMGNFEESLDLLSKAHALYPDNEQISRELSITRALSLTEECKQLFENGNYEMALEKCQAAIAENDQTPNAWNDQCIVLSALGRNDKAIVSCKRAVELYPTYAPFWFNLGNAYYVAGYTSESILAYENALSIDPTFNPAAEALKRIS